MLQKVDFSRAINQARESLKLSTTTLESGGPAPSFTVPVSCPICYGVGWVYLAERDRNDPLFGKSVTCKCRRQSFEERRRASLMKYCNLPEGAEDKTFESFRVEPGNEDALSAALGLLSGNVTFLTFVGPVNKGKTHLAISICHDFIDAGIPAKFYSCQAFLRDLRATFDRDATIKYREVFERACTVPMLVLDDFYAGKRTDWMEQELESIVDARYLNKKPTVFTTNTPLAEMSERIASRLQRESWCKVVVL